MASLSAEKTVETPSTLTCIIHYDEITGETCERFTNVRWATLSRCASSWSDTDGIEDIMAKGCAHLLNKIGDELPETVGYHPACYRKFTNKKRINQALEKKKKKLSLKRAGKPTEQVYSPKKLRSSSDILPSSSRTSVLPAVCIICKKKVKTRYNRSLSKNVKEILTRAETVDGGKLRHAAELKQDNSILQHIRFGDCVALEVQYHKTCYRNYTYCVDKQLYQSKDTMERGGLSDEQSQAYDVLCQNIIQTRLIEGREILRMSSIASSFNKTMMRTGNIDVENMRSDKLKSLLRKDFPVLCFQASHRRNVGDLVYSDNVPVEFDIPSTSESETDTMSSAESTHTESGSDVSAGSDLEARRVLFEAGIIIRNAIKEQPGMSIPWPPMSSDLTEESARSVIPSQLYNLLSWCIGASDDPISSQNVEVPESIRTKLLSICQDIVYLSSRGRKLTPKSVSLGLTVRHITGSTRLLNMLNKFGHCISVHSTLGLETSLAQLQLVTQSDIPKNMSKKTLTILVWDNIDFGEETLSGHGTTHHTNGIMVQHAVQPPSVQSSRISLQKGQRSLKAQQSVIAPFHQIKRRGPRALHMDLPLSKFDFGGVEVTASRRDFAYILLKYADLEKKSIPSWTGVNTQLSQGMTLEKSALHYLPVIEASPTELATVNAILKESIKIADRLELKEIVLVFDQAIYAKAQQIRWNDENLAQRLIIRLGDFHTCMSFLAVIGKRFAEAGLRDILIESGAIAHGSINGVLSGHHYNRSIRAHKLLYESMCILRMRAYINSLPDQDQSKWVKLMESLLLGYPSSSFLDIVDGEEFSQMMLSYDKFVDEMAATFKTFALWNSYIDMVGNLLMFVRATRESDWHLHVAAIRDMLPWYFAYDRVNYARYLPVYYTEMVNLPSTHPETFDALSTKGRWTVQRQDHHAFSSIACDQAIEQTINRESKTRGGISGFTLNRGAVSRWILAQPQRAAISSQCEIMSGALSEERNRKDLDSTRIAKDNAVVSAIISTIETMIDPFGSNEELVCITSGVVAKPEVCKDMLEAEKIGTGKLEEYVKNHVTSDKGNIFAPIKSSRLKTFGSQTLKVSKTTSGKDLALKNDRSLFARLLVIGQSRNIDLRNILSHSLGNVSYPLASTDGSLAKTNKAVLLNVIETEVKDCKVDTFPNGSALLIDGMAMLQSLSKIPETFGELAEMVLGNVMSIAREHSFNRVDFVSDRYPEISIKNAERSRRAAAGAVVLNIHGKNQKTPKRWKQFLNHGKNKEALIEFFVSHWIGNVATSGSDLDIFVTHASECTNIQLKSGAAIVQEVSALSCDHEEADTRLVFHAKHACEQYSNVVIRSPDTDVAIIALSSINQFAAAKVYFWIGVKTKSRIINLQKVADTLGPMVCDALIGIHTFSGCDSTSAFFGKGKKRAFDVARKDTSFLEAFSRVGQDFEINDDTYNTLERFVCNLYGQTVSNVDEARYKLFCVTSSSEQALPPTKDALRQHYKRANYQAAIHRRSTWKAINAPLPYNHGWRKSDHDLEIVWMTQDPAPQSILQLIHCGCKIRQCSSANCSCFRSNLPCTDLCKCTDCGNRERLLVELQYDDTFDSDSDDEE